MNKDFLSISNLLRVRQLRKQHELNTNPLSQHLVLTGNPGTGKTTIARLLARATRIRWLKRRSVIIVLMDVELSPQHDEVIKRLYDLRSDLSGISRDERLIIEMAIMMLEYLDEYAADVSFEETHDWSPEKLEKLRKRVDAARRASQTRWTGDDFERLICSSGFELHDGRLVPRF